MSDLIFKNIDKELEQTINDCLKGKEPMKTKFGTIKINYQGYYVITSNKEGNNNKYLHRLVWENHYKKLVPEGYDIHHINNNKLDNRIQNLQCVKHSNHISFHMRGENNSMYNQEHTKETREKISKTYSKRYNTTGYYRVTKSKDKTCKQGFKYVYQYYEDGKRKKITSVNINKLEEKIRAKGLEWFKIEDMI